MPIMLCPMVTRFLQSQLFETSPLDQAAFAGATLVIVACWSDRITFVVKKYHECRIDTMTSQVHLDL